jgi:DNA-binding transcriptional MerR regulator
MPDFESPIARTGRAAADHDTPLSINDVSKMFKVSRIALRAYERLGLIKRRDRSGGRPVYGWVDCERIAFILKARRVGLTARQVAPIIRGAAAEAPIEAVKAGRTRCFELMDQLDRRRRELRDALAELRYLDKVLSQRLPSADQDAAAGSGDSPEPACDR